MTMESKDLSNLKESKTIELKAARGGIPKTVYETFSSFANTDGGTVYLGIEEGKPNIVAGLSENACEAYKKELLLTIQNATEISLPVFGEEDIEEIPLGDGRFVLAIHVKEADRFQKPVYLNDNLPQSFIRRGDGDFRLRQNQITSYLCDAHLEDLDSQPNSAGYSFNDISLSTLREYRKCLNEFSPANVYRDLDDEEFLRKTAMLVENGKGKEVLTNAAVILFTSSPFIETLFPYYVLDYQRKEAPGSKWEDRVATDDPSWSGNAFDFFLLSLQALSPYIPSAYVGEKNRNNGPQLMHDAVKEMLVNALSNHAFLLNGSLSVTRLPTSLVVSNNGKMLVEKEQAVIGGVSNPRNPSIMAAFRRIGASDRAGTGIPKIEDALRKNGFPPLSFVESSDPVDQTSLSIAFVSIGKREEKGKAMKLISLLSSSDSPISMADIIRITGWSRSTVASLLREGLESGAIKDNGKEKRAKKYFLS